MPETEELPIFHVQKNQFCLGQMIENSLITRVLSTYLESAHARQCKLLDVGLESLVPALPGNPFRAVTSVGSARECTLIPSAVVDTVDPETAVVNGIAPFAGSRQAKCSHRVVHICAPRVARNGQTCGVRLARLTAEADVRVVVDSNAVSARQEACPLCERVEPIVVENVRALALTNTACRADNLVGLHVAVPRVSNDNAYKLRGQAY